MFRPCFSATQVAGAIGRHKFQTTHQVMYEVFKKDPVYEKKIEELEKFHNRKAILKFKGSILKDREIQRSVFEALDNCKIADAAVANEINATTVLVEAENRSHQLDLKKAAGETISEAEQVATEAELLRAKEVKKQASEAVAAAPSVNDTLDSVEKTCKTVLSRRPDLSPEMATQILADARGEVMKKRGLQNETAILDKYEVERKVVVKERNTRMLRMDKDTFVLVGRTDGYVEEQDRVVDSKDRTTYWKTVPIYDEIQLRVYMHLLDAAEAELIERFPNGSTRTTIFKNDPELWADIEANLTLTTKRMNDILADASSLEELVFKNTIENGN
jgi:hypothetical protein